MITKKQYVAYLIRTPQNSTCTYLAEHLEEVSHDVVNDLLRQKRFMPREVWRLFENSRTEQEAREALAALRRLPVDRQKPEQFQTVTRFLAEHFVWLTTFLRHKEVKRNSLAESGMRVLRRLEVEHDGFRSEKGRANVLRIYQAVKYRGWTVHRSPLGAAEVA
jgi:hypothetical protein